MSIYLYQALMGLSSGLLYFLTAAGMAIIVSGLNVINFGQGAFCMFGTLLCYSVYRMTGSFFLGLLAAIVVSGLFGGYVTEAMLRPIYKRPALFQLLLTMGVGYILQDFFLLAWGNTMVTASIPKALDFRINLIGMPFPFYYIFLIIISLCICAVMLYVFKKTKVGMIFRAIITNREMVDCMGINVKVMNSLMFMVGISHSSRRRPEPACHRNSDCCGIPGAVHSDGRSDHWRNRRDQRSIYRRPDRGDVYVFWRNVFFAVLQSDTVSYDGVDSADQAGGHLRKENRSEVGGTIWQLKFIKKICWSVEPSWWYFCFCHGLCR